MTDTATFAIPTDLVDDTESARTDSYTDPKQPLPIAAGLYPVRITKTRLRTVSKTDPSLFLIDGKYPVIEVLEAVIVNPDGHFDGRTLNYLGDIRTNPREESRGGVRVKVNDLADAIGSADASIRYGSLNEGLEVFNRLVADQTLFHVKVDWIADDYKGAAAFIERKAESLGLTVEDFKKREKKDANEIRYDRYQRKGMAKFRNPVTGEFETEVDFAALNGGIGSTARVNVKLTGWESSTSVTAGKVKVGPVRLYLQVLEQQAAVAAHAAA